MRKCKERWCEHREEDRLESCLEQKQDFCGVRTSTSTDTNIRSFDMKLCWVKPVVLMCLAPSHVILVLLACPQILALSHQNR